MKNLNEKIAIVTGSGQGIGKGIALHLSKRGVKVVCIGRRLEPVEQTIKEIKEFGGEGFAMSCDVANREQVKAVVAETVKRYGTVDVIVNNAQSLPGSSRVEDVTYDEMLLAWNSGVIGSLNFMQECLPYMKEQNEGRVINFASATGLLGYENHVAYGSNKEAIRGLTKIAGKEWGKYNILVNCILPGAESPAMKVWAEKHPKEYEDAKTQNPMRRFGDPEEDMGRMVAFLAGPDCTYMSGQSLIVDGAYTITA